MKKMEQWVLFIDMLGYQEINGKISNDKEANNFLDFMKSNENEFAKQNNESVKEGYKGQPYDLYEFYDIQTTFVSDSLIINYKPKELNDNRVTKDEIIRHSANTLFIILNRLQIFIIKCLSDKNILIRGGISNKYCSIRDNFAVGEGLIDAYNSESTRAIYPRIVLSENIINNHQIIDSFDMIASKIYKTDSFLKHDGDNVYYLDYLKLPIRMVFTTMLGDLKALSTIDSWLNIHKEKIEEKLKEIDLKIQKESDEDKIKFFNKIKNKIVWLKDYHNESIKGAIPKFKIEY